MRSRATIAALRIGLLLAAGSWAVPSQGADPALGPWGELSLKGGRVLHSAKVLSDEGDNLVMRCDEGLVKVAKLNLPQAVAEAYATKPAEPSEPQMVMMPFDPDKAPLVEDPDDRPKPKAAAKAAAAPVEAAVAAPSLVFKGCTIASFTMRAFQSSLGCAEVVVQNDTDARAVIFPRDIACVTADGKRLVGRQIVMDGFPPVIKRRQVVPPLASADFQVTFSNEALDISGVRWAR